MERFEFHNPTRILFGKGEVNRVGMEVSTFGQKALLVMGTGSAKRTGAFQKATKSLKDAGVEYLVLEGVRSNPVLSKVREGVKIAREEGVEVVFALGGGSVMDTAKAIAAGVLMDEGSIWDVFLGKRMIDKALPVVTCPTLAASGSEMNGFMVITNEGEGYKLATGSPHVYPKVSILDPELTYSVPPDYTAYGGVDAVCHLMEPYFNGPASYTPIQDGIAEALMKTIMYETRGCIEDPESYEHRGAIMWGATLALNGLTKAGVGTHRFPVHLMEHAVSVLFNVPHGAGLSALLPGWLRYFSGVRPEKVAQFSKNVLGISGHERPEGLIEKGISAFCAWLESIGCPTSLRGLGIGEKDLDEIAKNALFQARLWGIDREYDRRTLRHILGFAI